MSFRSTTLAAVSTVALGGLLAVAAWAQSNEQEKETLETRISPVGEVCMAGESCAAAAVADASGSGPRSGADVYSSKCFTCHATGAAGAPKLGDTGAWESRLAERGRDALYQNAIEGYNAMPAKGLCLDCSDEEIVASVDHILSESGL